MSHQPEIPVQRSPSGTLLGVVITVGAGDLAFIDPGTKWVKVDRKPTANGCIVTVTAGAGAKP